LGARAADRMPSNHPAAVQAPGTIDEAIHRRSSRRRLKTSQSVVKFDLNDGPDCYRIVPVAREACGPAVLPSDRTARATEMSAGASRDCRPFRFPFRTQVRRNFFLENHEARSLTRDRVSRWTRFLVLHFSKAKRAVQPLIRGSRNQLRRFRIPRWPNAQKRTSERMLCLIRST
jgi:hypothetical protein